MMNRIQSLAVAALNAEVHTLVPRQELLMMDRIKGFADAVIHAAVHDFLYFISKWGLYKKATKIPKQTLVDELWTCMSEDLKSWHSTRG